MGIAHAMRRTMVFAGSFGRGFDGEAQPFLKYAVEAVFPIKDALA